MVGSQELLARASAEQPGDGVLADGRPAPMPAVARLRGGWSTRHVLLLFGLCFITGGDCMPVSALQASLTYSRASIYDGLPAGLVDTMHGVMDNRLSSSTPHRVDPRLHALAGQVGGHVLVAMCRL